MGKKLSIRGFELVNILSKPNGNTELILKILDLENEIEELLTARKVESDLWPEIELSRPVEICEWVGKDGFTLDNPPSESVWLESLSTVSDLDIRAIASDNLPTEVGLHSLRISTRRMVKSAKERWMLGYVRAEKFSKGY